MVKDPWTIPFNGTTFVSWKDNRNRWHRALTATEEREYFSAQNKEKFLYDLLNSER
jgi:hypothetical protein